MLTFFPGCHRKAKVTFIFFFFCLWNTTSIGAKCLKWNCLMDCYDMCCRHLYLHQEWLQWLMLNNKWKFPPSAILITIKIKQLHKSRPQQNCIQFSDSILNENSSNMFYYTRSEKCIFFPLSFHEKNRNWVRRSDRKENCTLFYRRS